MYRHKIFSKKLLTSIGKHAIMYEIDHLRKEKHFRKWTETVAVIVPRTYSKYNFFGRHTYP